MKEACKGCGRKRYSFECHECTHKRDDGRTDRKDNWVDMAFGKGREK